MKRKTWPSHLVLTFVNHPGRARDARRRGARPDPRERTDQVAPHPSELCDRGRAAPGRCPRPRHHHRRADAAGRDRGRARRPADRRTGRALLLLLRRAQPAHRSAPRKGKGPNCSSQNASVVSAGCAATKRASECGRPMVKNWDLAFLPADDPNGFAKVDLRMSRRVAQRHKHLLRSLPPLCNVILHNRVAAREPCSPVTARRHVVAVLCDLSELLESRHRWMQWVLLQFAPGNEKR
jgi:hypothetical protein